MPKKYYKDGSVRPGRKSKRGQALIEFNQSKSTNDVDSGYVDQTESLNNNQDIAGSCSTPNRNIHFNDMDLRQWDISAVQEQDPKSFDNVDLDVSQYEEVTYQEDTYNDLCHDQLTPEQPRTDIDHVINIPSLRELAELAIRTRRQKAVNHDHYYFEPDPSRQEAYVIMQDKWIEKNRHIDEGCRIIDHQYYMEQMLEMNDHGALFDCNFNNMKQISERRLGLASMWRFECLICGFTKNILSHRCLIQQTPKEIKQDGKVMNINQAAVAGTIMAGVGEVGLDKLLGALNVPSMSSSTYAKYAKVVGEDMENCALMDMKNAAKREVAIAREKGNVTPDGTPLVTVITDGSWCKRSYRNTYNSTGGVGVVIGAETKQVLYVGVKNKFCVICTKARNRKEEPKEHVCFKNWPEGQSAASMETAVVREAFRQSKDMYGIIYHKLIADGDSSVYKAILDDNPYENLIVQKIECKNHLFRNFCNNLQAECASSSGGNRELVKLKMCVADKVLKLRSAINKAITHRTKDGINPQTALLLSKDIINAPSHVFGEHEKCAELVYFCDGKRKEDEENLIPLLTKHGLYSKIMTLIHRLADNSMSLLHNVTNNIAESFNSIIAAKLGGKRINYTARNGYHARVACAVSTLAHGEPLRILHKTTTKRSPGKHVKKVEQSLLQKRLRQRARTVARKKLNFEKTKVPAVDYGSKSQKPDMTPEEYEIAKQRRLEWLSERVKDRKMIEETTREQRDSVLWTELRLFQVTASNMGRICKLRPTTDTSATVKSMLHTSFDVAAVRWGRDKEQIAKSAVAKGENLNIEECGLFVHPQHSFIGASPDGVIGDDALLEVKCPYSARKMTISQAIEKGKVKFWKRADGSVNTNDNWYYQVQGQLEVTGRNRCAFVVWTLHGYKLEWIPRDEQFWKIKMEPKILAFYHNCLIPEIVDSRMRRSMPYRPVNFLGKTVVLKSNSKATRNDEKVSGKLNKSKKAKDKKVEDEEKENWVISMLK